jgi:hypothetical protein
MHGFLEDRIAHVTQALAQAAHGVEHHALCGWDFQLVNGKPFSVKGRLIGEWLTFWSPLDLAAEIAEERKAVWRCAELNAHLPGAAKLAVCPEDGRVVLCADIAVPDDAHVADRVAGGCRDLEEAWSCLAGDPIGCDDPRDMEGRGLDANPTTDFSLEPGTANRVLELASQLGWTTRNNDDRAVVDLAPDEAFYQAAAAELDGRVRLLTEVGPTESHPAASRPAVGWLLLTMSGFLRGVRGAISFRKDREYARLEAVLPPRPSTFDVDHALNALSVACNTVGHELRVLAHPHVARAYLIHTRSGG